MLPNSLCKFYNKKVLLLGAAVLIIAGTILWVSTILTSESFYDGLSIEGINISGMELEDARKVVQDGLDSMYGNSNIVLLYGDNSWKLRLEDVSGKFLVDEALKQAYSVGRHGNIPERLRDITLLRIYKKDINTKIVFDRSKLQGILLDIKKQVDKPETDAKLIYSKDKIDFKKEVTGLSVNIEKNMNLVEYQILERRFTSSSLFVDEKKAKILYNDIKDINGVLASFGTTFNAGDLNRTHNIRLAGNRINGTILMPEEIFSMNKALGPRTLENGYKDAPVIYKNELIKGPGGGVCQVTTTLYNAALKSKIDIVERTHHSLPLGYVAPGQDATIAEDYIDLKFQNSTGYAVYIYAEVSGNALNMRILGKKQGDEYIVKLKSEVMEEYIPDEAEIIVDNTIPDDEMIEARKAKKGMRVILYRETYNKKGELLKREKINDDVYKPVRAQIKVNQNYLHSYNMDDIIELMVEVEQ